MFTIDASVWVNGLDQNEAGHAISRQFLQEVGQQAISVTVPTFRCTDRLNRFCR